MRFSLNGGARSPFGRWWRKARAWLKALRLQFYPMSWAAYTIGAIGAAGGEVVRSSASYWLGYCVVFFGKACTVFVNEWFDYDSDRRNTQSSLFNGGSRVLVDGHLQRKELRAGVFVVLLAMITFAAVLVEHVGGLPLAVVLSVAVILGLGYTAPPLKLAWRGLGELDVAVMHSLLMIMLGYLGQGGQWSDPFPWLVAAPLLVAIFPSIILSGLPDAEADRAAGKNTLAVRWGVKPTLLAAAGTSAGAVLLAVLLKDLPVLRGSLDGLIVWAAPHAVLLIALIIHYWWRGAPVGRIDGLMVASMSYVVWFVLFPLLNLW